MMINVAGSDVRPTPDDGASIMKLTRIVAIAQAPRG